MLHFTFKLSVVTVTSDASRSTLLPPLSPRTPTGFVGDPNDGIGYIDLSGFANDAGREVRYAIKALQHGASEIAAGDDATRDGVGMVATDPTKLKVRHELLTLPLPHLLSDRI